MSNAIEVAKKYILMEIDNDVLQYAFAKRVGSQMVSAISVLENTVIRNNVIADLNLLDGEEKKVPVSNCILKYNRSGTMLLEVPKNLLNNRPILSADYLISAPLAGFGAPSMGGTSGLLKRMFNTVSTPPVDSNARIDVVSENLIKLEGVEFLDPYSMLSVRVQNNPNLSNLPATTHVKFAELCELAVQKWIYTHKRKEINTNVLTGGAELVELKTIVDEWSDSKEAYREARTKFIGIMNMANIRFQNEIVKSQVGNLQY